MRRAKLWWDSSPREVRNWGPWDSKPHELHVLCGTGETGRAFGETVGVPFAVQALGRDDSFCAEVLTLPPG